MKVAVRRHDLPGTDGSHRRDHVLLPAGLLPGDGLEQGQRQVVVAGPVLEDRLEGQAARGLPEQGRQHAPGSALGDERRAERRGTGPRARSGRGRRGARPATGGGDPEDAVPAAGMIRWRPIRSRSLGFMLLAAASSATVRPSAREMRPQAVARLDDVDPGRAAGEPGRPGADQQAQAEHRHRDRDPDPDQAESVGPASGAGRSARS